jgi:hypothetical protein
MTFVPKHPREAETTFRCLCTPMKLVGTLVVMVGMVITCLSSTASASTGGDSSQSAVGMPLPPNAVASAFENPTRWVGRDEGFSVPLPNGNDLWIFGDTPTASLLNGSFTITKKVRGSTAMEGPTGGAWDGYAEVNIGEPLDTSNLPSEFIPQSSLAVYLPDGSGKTCTVSNGATEKGRWPSGAALIPGTNEVFVTYYDVCSIGGSYPVEGWGFMEYNWATNEIDVGPTDVFKPSPTGAALPSNELFGSPVFKRGTLYLYSASCSTSVFGTCASGGQVWVTTVGGFPDNAASPSSFVPVPLATTESAAWFPFGPTVDVHYYPGAGWRMIEQTNLGGGFALFSASSPSGPWSLESDDTIPGCQQPPRFFCYAFFGHPELSTSTQLALTYFDPGEGPVIDRTPSGPLGHVMEVPPGTFGL